MDVRQVLLVRIAQFIEIDRAQSIHLLDVTNRDVDHQLKQGLKQAKDCGRGDRLVIIPYHLGNSHWTAILIEFTDENQLNRVEWINPVQQSNDIPDELKENFSEIFPNDLLRIRTCHYIGHRDVSANLMIKNVLEIINESTRQSIKINNERTYSHDQPSHDSFPRGNPSTFSHSVKAEREESFRISSREREIEPIEESDSIRANDTRSYEELKEQLKEHFNRLDIESESELDALLVKKKQRMDELKKQGDHEGVRKRAASLARLEEVYLLISQMNNDERSLKTQIENGFSAHDIENKEELKELIKKKKKRVEKLQEERNADGVRRREKSLSELEDLQLLVERYNASHLSRTTTKVESLSLPIGGNLSENIDQQEGPITQESLNHIYSDFSSMPSCPERSTLALLYYISLQVIETSTEGDVNVVRPNNIEREIEKEWKILQVQLQLEGSSSSEMSDCLAQLSIHIRNANWEDCLILLRNILREISPLNVHDLFRLIEKVDDAAELIKNKDIIFLLGGTGSGKSTTIHFLAGSKMIETKLGGLNHIAATELKYPNLRFVTTSPYAKSETRCITPINVNFEDMGILRNGSTLLCDTPGFEDTNGAEVDIANGISIVKAIQQCKSVKPVVLVSYKSIGDRFEGLKNLTHLLAKLIPGIKDQIQAFSYLFTKYPLDERETIHASLKNLAKTFNEQEKSDQSFMNLFADMLDKTECRILVVDPIRDQPSKLLKELVASATISNPSEVFEFSITEKSKAIVHEQVRKYQMGLISAVERDEYPLIKYQLGQLRRLNDLLHQDSLQKIYTDCIERVSKHLSDQYQIGTSLLGTTLTHQTIISAMDIEQYQTYLEHAYAAEQLRKDHLFEGKTIHSSAFVQYLNRQVADIDADLREKHFDHISIKAQLDKIKLLTEYFAQVRSPCESLCQYAVVIKEIYASLCQSFSEKIELKVKSFHGFIAANDFHECGMMMSSLAEALNQFRDHLDTEMIKTNFFQLRQALIKYLIDSVKALDALLKKKVLEKVDIDQMNACLMNITKALATSTLEVHVSKRELQPIHDDCLAKMVTFCENLIREIKSELKKEHHWNHLESHIQQLDLIRTISSVAGETSQVYHSTLEELFGRILQLRRDVEELLRILFQGGEKVDFEKLLKYLVTLKSVSWIENYRKGLYSKMIQDVEQLILQHVERLKQSIEQTNLDLGHAQEIKPVVYRLSNLHEMRHLDSFIPTINTKIEEIHTWFSTTIEETLKIIKNTFSPERCNEQGYRSLDSIEAEKALEYLDACTQSSISMKAKYASVLYELECFVRNYSDLVRKEMETSFDIIKTCNETGACEIFNRARLLANRLQEISDIEKTSPRVLSCFSTKTMVEDWQTELSSYRSELSNEMARLSVTQSTEVLNSKLTTSKALSKLDKFIDDGRYIDLYNEYQKVFFTQNDDIARQVVDAIKSFDYEGVAVKMLTLDSSSEVGKHFYREAKRLLTAGIDQLIEGTENQVIILGNSISLDDIKAIVENFKRMERAKQFIPNDLYPPHNIDAAIKNAKEIMSKRIKQYLVGVRSLIVNHNFYEADGKTDSITQVKNLLSIVRIPYQHFFACFRTPSMFKGSSSRDPSLPRLRRHLMPPPTSTTNFHINIFLEVVFKKLFFR